MTNLTKSYDEILNLLALFPSIPTDDEEKIKDFEKLVIALNKSADVECDMGKALRSKRKALMDSM